MKAIISIQRRWRVKYHARFRIARTIQKNHQLKKTLFSATIGKYLTSRDSESELLSQVIMFERECRNLQSYTWRQQVAYHSELEFKNKMAA